jgi:hypothetical protein
VTTANALLVWQSALLGGVWQSALLGGASHWSWQNALLVVWQSALLGGASIMNSHLQLAGCKARCRTHRRRDHGGGGGGFQIIVPQGYNPECLHQ